jgi:L-aspartate oxidase
MLVVARIVVAAALEREESRGVHFRTDFPEMDNQHWHKRITMRRESS